MIFIPSILIGLLSLVILIISIVTLAKVSDMRREIYEIRRLK